MSVYSISVSEVTFFKEIKFRLNARSATNERETSSVDVSKVVHVRSGINIHPDNYMTPVRFTIRAMNSILMRHLD